MANELIPTLPLSPISTTLQTSNLLQQTRGSQATGITNPVVVPGTPVAAQQNVTPTNAPKPLLNMQVTQTPSKQLDRVFSQVVLSFQRDSSDRNFYGVQIWAQGYKGNTTLVSVGGGTSSPVTFLLEATKETIRLFVQPYSSAGVFGTPAQQAQSIQVTLTGQTNPPPAPTIFQQATALPGAAGWQLQFNFLQGITNDVISGYWIYKVSSHSPPTPPANRYKFVLHSNWQAGVYTFQDVTSGTWFYYVSAVNIGGLESTLADAGGGTGGTLTIYRPSSSSSTGTTYANPANVWDGNNSTFSVSQFTSTDTTWAGWPTAGGTPTAINLKIITSVTSFGGFASLSYSINGGSTFTSIYSNSGTRSTQTYTIALSTSQNISQVQVKAQNSTHNAAVHYIYEAWIEVTT